MQLLLQFIVDVLTPQETEASLLSCKMTVKVFLINGSAVANMSECGHFLFADSAQRGLKEVCVCFLK